MQLFLGLKIIIKRNSVNLKVHYNGKLETECSKTPSSSSGKNFLLLVSCEILPGLEMSMVAI